MVECTIPVLPVADLARSVRFYTETLGFSVDWRGEVVCSVSRDGRPLMLSCSEDKPAGPAWAWVGVQDDSLFAALQQRGAVIKQPPQNHVWGYEMKIEDPDGNVLWLGTGPRADLPFDDAPG